jgi:MFS family permease
MGFIGSILNLNERCSRNFEPVTVTAPIPVLGERVLWRDTFIALRTHNYRLYVISQFIANTSGWMQRIATDWLVLELTGNVALVGLTVAFQFAPILILGPYGGVIADRYSKRALLIITQSINVALCALLAALALTGTVQLWQVYGVALILGLVAVVDSPARSVFVTEMVGQHRLRNAISINASIFHLGGLLGPAVSGVMIVLVGSGWSIAINAVGAAIVVLTLSLMRTKELHRSPRSTPARGQIREALRYARAKPAIFWTLITLSFVSIFGMSLPIILAGMAHTVFHAGSAGYGIYNSFVAIGAMTGAILSTRRRTMHLRNIVLGAIAYGVLQLFAGLADWYVAFLMILPCIGLARLMFATAAESMTQLSSNIAIRGRVMSLYAMVLVGGQAIGGPLMGAVAEHFGARTALITSGAIPAIAATVIAIVLARSGELQLGVRLNRPVSLVRALTRSRVLIRKGQTAA